MTSVTMKTSEPEEQAQEKFIMTAKKKTTGRQGEGGIIVRQEDSTGMSVLDFVDL